jgi:hypothetical protein
MRSFAKSHEFVAYRYQAIASSALLMVLLATCLMIDLVARNKSLERWLMAKSTIFAERNGTVFSNTGNFIDFEDRVLLDEIPQVDYSRGGVYFFGSSNMKWAFTTWDLPEEQKRLIHNYGIGASNHTIQLQLIRYLMEQRKFLTAGDKDLVIFGVTFQLAHIDDPSTGFFVSLLRRHGLYTITPDGQIAAVPMSAVAHWLRIEKARSGGLFWNMGRLVKSRAAAFFGWSIRPPPKLLSSPDALRGFMGGARWQQNTDTELERLRETIVLLRSHHTQVKVILLPQGSWMNELPYKPYYEAKLRSLCLSTSTPLIDLSQALPDSAFADSSHLTVDGQRIFRDLIVREISGQLQKLQTINRASPGVARATP